jgi:tellurite resistance protein TerC
LKQQKKKQKSKEFVTHRLSVLDSSELIEGALMIVTPGPAIIVIPMGLAILASEFAWARHWLALVRKRTDAALGRTRPDT